MPFFLDLQTKLNFPSPLPNNRSSTTLESLSRTLRTYVPSSIHIPIPTAAPSPPLVSRPVSFGWFSGQGQQGQAPGQTHGQGQRTQGHERSYSESSGASPVVGYQEPAGRAAGYGGGGYQEYDHQRGYGYGHGQGHGHGHGHGPGLPYPVPVGRQQGWEEERHHHQQGAAAYGAPGAGGGMPGYEAAAGSGLAQAMRRVGSPRGVDPGGGGGGDGGRRVGEGDGIGSYPLGDTAPGQADAISWAKWDELDDRRLLLLAYPAGLQMWDCTNLSSITEVLNLNFTLPEWDLLGGGAGVRVVHAAVLAAPRLRGTANDPLAADRPLLGIIMESDEDEPESTLFLYSLRRHHLVKRLPMPGLAERFLSNEHFIVISTTTPPSLYILSTTTFHTLSTISSASLLPYMTPTSSSATYQHKLSSSSISTHANNNNNNIAVSLGPGLLLDSPSPSPSQAQHHPVSVNRPHPVFALNGRLLAYASSRSVPPGDDTRRTSFSSASSGPSGSSLSASPFGFTKGLPKTQAELGTAALKVGGSVLSGMKFLGGMAYEAAKSRVVPEATDGLVNAGKARAAGAGLAPGLTNRFFSRSAPAAAGSGDDGGGRAYDDLGGGGQKRDRRYSNTSVGAVWDAPLSPSQDHPSTVAPHTAPPPETGYFVTVSDLAPLWSGSDTPATVAEFVASRTQSVTDLRFSEDGCTVLVVPREGQTVKMYQIRPTPGVLRGGPGAGARGSEVEGADDSGSRSRQNNAWHLYNLRRGRTSAVVEGLDWTGDGRWVAVGTRKRTVHVFAVNPYGGQPDHRSHLEGRVRNAEELQPLSTEVGPLLRLRVVKHPAPDQPKAPLAFTFICPSNTSYPSNLLPLATSPPPIDPTASPPLSPFRQHRPTNFQDVLMFDPTDGMLYLRRFTLDQRPKDQGISVSASMSALGATSISLPGMGGAGRLSSSPSSGSNRTPVSRVSKLTQMMETPMELAAKESIVATWNVQRHHDWGEIKKSLEQQNQERRSISSHHTGNADADWLAEAELSTFSRSKYILPRALYASHQFSFYTLGEDYHALIRRYQLDISGNKIDVRHEVEVSAHSAGVSGESFVEGGFSAPRDIRRATSSFDEPLASALSGGIDYQTPAAVIPMYPNGTPGSKPKSFRNSIPIRTMAGIGDGMTEGLGRIRRKVRSPNLLPRSDNSLSGPVPLEFDEEDEDFVLTHDSLDVPGRSHNDDESASRITVRGAASAESEPSTSAPGTRGHTLEDGLVETGDDDMWRGWESQDRQAIEDAERFDDISAVGFLDEEHTSMMKAAAEKRKRSRRRNDGL